MQHGALEVCGHLVNCLCATATQTLQRCSQAWLKGLPDGIAARSWGQCRDGTSMPGDTHLRDAGRLLKAQPVRDVHDEALRGRCLLCITTAIEQGHHLQACLNSKPPRMA